MATVHDLIVQPQVRPLVGIVPVPPDDEIAHLALLLAALCTGTSELRRLGTGEAVNAVARAIAELGVHVEPSSDGSCQVRGVGLRGLGASSAPLRVGSSMAALHALAGVLAAQPFASELVGDDGVTRTDVSALAGALRLRGARIEGVFSPTRVGAIVPPLQIGALELPHLLGETEQALPGPGPHVKNALMLSGLFADGPTYVSEPLVSRDHGERLLQALDVELSTAGSMVHLASPGWGARLPSFRTTTPGDFGCAALLLTSALSIPESRVGARDVGLNRTRTGFLELAREMGAPLEVEVHGNPMGEPVGVAVAGHAPLSAMVMDGEMLGRAAGELPQLLALAAHARGLSQIAAFGSGQPAVDRFVRVLRAFGVACEAGADGIAVQGRAGAALSAADIVCEDADDAALALVLALTGGGRSRLRGVDSLARRFPRIVGTFRALGADLHVEQRTE